MNEDVTHEPTAIKPSFTKAPKWSDMYYIYWLFCVGAIIFGVISVSQSILRFIDKGSVAQVRDVAVLIGYGIYPIITGSMLLFQTRREGVVFSEGRLSFMLISVSFLWIGLLLLIDGLRLIDSLHWVGSLGATHQISAGQFKSFVLSAVTVLAVYVAVFIWGLVWFRKALKPGRKAELEKLEPRDPNDATHTWFVEEAGREKKRWRLSLYPDAIQLEDSNKTELLEIPKSHAREKIALRPVGGDEVWMYVWGSKHVKIRLDANQQAVAKDWIRPHTMKELKASLNWWLILCVLFSYGFAMWPIMSWSYINSATVWRNVTLLNGLMALLLIGIALAAHYRPHRMVYLFIGALVFFATILTGVDQFLTPIVTHLRSESQILLSLGVATYSVMLWLIGIALAAHYRPHRIVYLFMGVLVAFVVIHSGVHMFVIPITTELRSSSQILLLLGVSTYSVMYYRRFANVSYEWDNRTKMSGQVIFTLIMAIFVLVRVVFTLV